MNRKIFSKFLLTHVTQYPAIAGCGHSGSFRLNAVLTNLSRILKAFMEHRFLTHYIRRNDLYA